MRQYRQEVEQWRQLVVVGTSVEQGVKTHGLSPRSAQQLPHQWAGVGTLPRTQQLGAELGEFVAAEAAKAKEGERGVGRSEVIESIFGKWKRLEGEQARSGLASLPRLIRDHQLPEQGEEQELVDKRGAYHRIPFPCRSNGGMLPFFRVSVPFPGGGTEICHPFLVLVLDPHATRTPTGFAPASQRSRPR
jgi:hypothetical protein